MPRASRQPDTFEEDLPFSSPLGRILFGVAVVVVGLAWLVSACNRARLGSVAWAGAMTAGGVGVIVVGVRGLLRQLDHGRQARRALDEHPELELELRRAKQEGKSPGRVLLAKGYENSKVRRAILSRVDLS